MKHEPALCPHCGAPSGPRLFVSHIQATVAAYYGIPVRHMTSDRRDWEVSHPRQVAMYLCAELTPKSYPDLGRLFHRDHTTIIWAEKSVQRRMNADPEFAEDVRALRERLSPESTVIHSQKEPESETNSPISAIEQSVNKQAEKVAA